MPTSWYTSKILRMSKHPVGAVRLLSCMPVCLGHDTFASGKINKADASTSVLGLPYLYGRIQNVPSEQHSG